MPLSVPLAALALLAGLAAATPTPPATPLEPVVDHYGDVAVTDNYRWLEDDASERTHAWVRQQNAAARAWLDALPDRAAIGTARQALESGHRVSYWGLRVAGGLTFALKDAPPLQQPVLVVLRDADDLSSERVLLDPNRIDAAGGVSINWYRPSPDGRRVAVCLSDNSERGSVRVLDTRDGAVHDDRVPRVNFATAGGDLAWLADGSGFLYTHYPRPGERPDADLDFYTTVYRHRLGTPASADRYETGADFPRLAEIHFTGHADGWQFARVADGDSQRFAFYARSPRGRWQRFLSPADEVSQVAPASGRLLLLTTRHAPRGEVLALPLRADGPEPLAHAWPFAAQPAQAAIQSILLPDAATTHSPVFLRERDGGPDRVRRLDADGADRGALPLPPVAALSQWAAADDTQVLYCVSQYVAPMRCYRLGAPDRPLAISERADVGLEDLEVLREFATAPDGTRVPLTIVHRKDLPLSATTPTILTGYGESGGESPDFNPNLRLLADAGVTWVDTHVRGGSDYGMAWHRAGTLLEKHNTFDDFIACAERLIALGYTGPAHLAIEGSSAGGLLVGVALTQRPDLFKAAVADVGIFDMLREEQSANGAFNTQQFGSVRDPAQLRALYAYSPYQHVLDGRRYPDVLLLGAATDSHVAPMNSRKMAARLQAASRRSTTLLRTSASDGHGIATAFSEQVEQDSDAIAFELSELGVRFPQRPEALDAQTATPKRAANSR